MRCCAIRPRLTTRPSVPDPAGGDSRHSTGTLPLRPEAYGRAGPGRHRMSRSAGQRRGLVPPGSRVPLIVDCQTHAGQTRGHPRTLAASPSMIAHESRRRQPRALDRPMAATGRRSAGFPSRRRATRPGLGGRSQGAIQGAIGGRYRATQDDAPRQSVQLSGLQSDARRRTATHRRCLLNSESRVRILPGALTETPSQCPSRNDRYVWS